MSDLTCTHLDYDRNRDNWRLVRDLVMGESALKHNDLQGISTIRTVNQTDLTFRNIARRYLPIPDATNCELENLSRYSQYVQRASLFNATKRTEQGMAGMVFQKNSEVDLPGSVEYLEDDADGSEVGLEQQSSEVLNDVLETGREGLLVDFPDSEDTPTTIQEAEELAKRSNIVVYKAESILDWDEIKVNAAMKLSYVKLEEVVSTRDPSNPFVNTEETQFRVLLLVDGLYEQRIYKGEDLQTFDTLIPVDAKGARFSYIPFFFIGAVNNRPNVDPAPLIEIAEVNIAHYRNSADFEESAFVVGQPTVVVTGLTQTWKDDNFENGIGFGSRGGISLGKDMNAQILQVAANTMPESGMDRKERQMVELGARLITDGGGAETAEAARIRHGADASVLKVVVRNIITAYKDAINAVLQFQGGAGEDFEFKLNTNFFAGELSAEELGAKVAAWQQGAISKPVLDKLLVKGKIISEDEDLEKMNDLIEEESTNTNLDFGE